MLAIRNLRHDYAGRTVLDVPAWDVARGDASLVLGPSGSGKTTLLNVIAGLAAPTAGSVRVAGEDVTRLTPAGRDAFRARRIGLVLQTLHLIGVISVRENLRLAQRLAGSGVDDTRIDEVLGSLGIAALAGARAREISVGEAQRVAIARAVVNRPALILADEPTSALDDANCERALALLLEQAAACGATLLVATHDNRIRGRFSRRLEL
ncbi:MAG: ATP-binding cassette domain-containing protein [Betaproteobacteria bacterium]|nr:ATP-binding cassette domain-containing protein [Betaproteobacteria bacterium]